MLAETQRKIETSLEEAFEYLALFNPALASLIRTIAHYASGEDQIAAAFATSRACYYTSKFTTFKILERVGVILHEWTHVALAHCERELALANRMGVRAAEIHNIAADLMINTWILEIAQRKHNAVALPDFVITIDSLEKQIPNFAEAVKSSTLAIRHNITTIRALAGYDVDTIFLVLLDVLKATGQMETLEIGGTMSGDVVRRPDPGASGTEGGQKTRAEAGQNADGSKSISHVIGALAGSDTWDFAGKAMAHLPSARVDWRRRLREVAGNALSSQRETSWSIPSRRLHSADRNIAFLPGHKREHVPILVCVLDTSSSVIDPVIDQFMSEICMTATITNHWVTVIEADTEVKAITRIGPHSPKFMPRKDTGRGGTDFNAGLRAAAKLNPDAIIYLTDLGSAAPSFRPKCPTIWCAVGNAEPMPFGRTVRIPIEAGY